MNESLQQREYWRSLQHQANAPEVQDSLSSEFAGYDPDQMRDGVSRRSLLKIMGASMALAGLTLTGCRRWPEEELAPYAARPKGRKPGVPEHYATSMELGGVANPLLVRSYDGRPIKVEGNPTHPASKTSREEIGSSSTFAQASLLEIYDPDRSRDVTVKGSKSDYASFIQAFGGYLKDTNSGVLCEATSGPTFKRLKKAFMNKFPKVRWFEYEAVDRDNEREGARMAFGQAVRPVLKLKGAAVISSFDDDLLGTHPNHLRHASDWADSRKSVDSAKVMNRLYIAESIFSVTGTAADERLGCTPAQVVNVLNTIAAKMKIAGFEAANLEHDARKFAEYLAKDLAAAGEHAVVAVGPNLPPEAHATAALINKKLKSKHVDYIADPEGDRPAHLKDIEALTNLLNEGEVETLLIIGGNPAFDAPADLKFTDAIGKAVHSAHLSVFLNETGVACEWTLNKAHYLECWGDAVSWCGTVSIGQPLIEPIFGGKSSAELLAMLTVGEELPLSAMRAEVKKTVTADEKKFKQYIHDGMVAGSMGKALNLSPQPVKPASVRESTMVARFVPDAHAYDGRFANSTWLQEMPEPLSTLVWDNAAYISIADAKRLGVTTGSMLNVSTGSRAIDIAAYVLPGQPEGVVTLPLGYGHTSGGMPIADKLGFNTYAVRYLKGHYGVGANVKKIDGSYELALTQDHHLIDEVGADGRDYRIGKDKYKSGYLIREDTLENYLAHPHAMHRVAHAPVKLQLFDPPHSFDDPHKWGMAIDMTACIGCNACVIACQAENNIPVVGKKQVMMHREMHWIRIDRYFKGDDTKPHVVYQPMMCVQCENAPCEQVCPVAATVHDTEGINTMVYNRCIGTRYCSNNCPYKVRRFNYFDWHAKPPREGEGVTWNGFPDAQLKEAYSNEQQVKRMVFNPDVTMRMRGVMEKCTYCIQRIKSVKIARRNAGEEVKDGDIVTACEQSCPTQAIVFGNLNDPEARVSKLHKAARTYAALAELNVRPRTQYMGRVRNPAEQPMIGKKTKGGSGH